MNLKEFNSLTDLFFYQAEKQNPKRIFLEWLNPKNKKKFTWSETSSNIYKLAKILKKNIKFLITLFILLGLSFHFNFAYAAGTSGSNGQDKASLYKSGKKLVLRAKKLEKKDKVEKAKKLYLKAYEKFEKAYAKDKKNADILNYLGYTLRKTGDFEKAETYYLKGLELDPNIWV